MCFHVYIHSLKQSTCLIRGVRTPYTVHHAPCIVYIARSADSWEADGVGRYTVLASWWGSTSVYVAYRRYVPDIPVCALSMSELG